MKIELWIFNTDPLLPKENKDGYWGQLRDVHKEAFFHTIDRCDSRNELIAKCVEYCKEKDYELVGVKERIYYAPFTNRRISYEEHLAIKLSTL